MYKFNFIVALAAVMLVSYLLGSINFSIIITRQSKFKTDIRTMGSGNAGFTNVLRSVGKTYAILTIIGDFLKCVLAILVCRLVFSSTHFWVLPDFQVIQYCVYLSGLSCFLGHIYPCFFGFKGGKGVVTAAAVILMTDWRIFLIVVGAFLICLLISKIVSLSSLVAAVAYPLGTFAINYFVDYRLNKISFTYVIISTIFSLTFSFVVAYSHRSNIKRLKNGTEKKINVKKN